MHEFLSLLKRAAVEAYDREQYPDVVVGTVSKETPLEITLEGGRPVRLAPRVNTPQMQKNDRVYLLRLRGGSHYLILDKAVTV